ncbi:permease [Cloacibacillus porcorum]|uniref:permease n=1 Tax=Cloacibacillus porcorum TaxID=1197717 RepID=UPI001459743C|nr:permease [Cloacibacillus porcorum]MCC8185709.1 permease [Cloacibacillus porcorum]MDY5390562.1 permease [Cloacibacillus porcorum]NMF16789.1 permease [Cloacibacillus porcorum]
MKQEIICLSCYFAALFKEIAPFWALGILLGSLISVFAKERIHGLLGAMQGARFGAFGVIPASILGIVSPLCMYGTIPIAASLSEKGLKDDWLAAFMMSSILLNPQLMIYSAALGKGALAVRTLSAFLCGAAAGLCVRYLFRGGNFFSFSGLQEAENRDTDPHMAMRLLKNILRNIKATGPYFLAGLLLAALFMRLVPPTAVAWLFGGDSGFGVLVAATAGVPLYACGGGTIPLLAEWMQSGMGLGAAAAFMITGPATKVTNLGALKIVLGMRNFLLYLLFIMAFAAVTGLVTDFLV